MPLKTEKIIQTKKGAFAPFFYDKKSIKKKLIPIKKDNGLYHLVSYSENFVPFTDLKNPTYLKSPIPLKQKIIPKIIIP